MSRASSLHSSARARSRRAAYTPSYNTTGWGNLTVAVNASKASKSCVEVPPPVASYAAGYIEGALTAEQIHFSWLNSVQQTTVSNNVETFVNDSNAYIETQVASAHKRNESERLYWANVNLTYMQLRGLYAGYNEHRNLDFHVKLSFMQMQLLQMRVELADISKAVNPRERVDWDQLSKGELDEYKQKHSHCSAMVKVVPDLSELYASHTTWCSYSSMIRLFKTYQFPGFGNAHTVMFSGYVFCIVFSKTAFKLCAKTRRYRYPKQFHHPGAVPPAHCYANTSTANDMVAILTQVPGATCGRG